MKLNRLTNQSQANPAIGSSSQTGIRPLVKPVSGTVTISPAATASACTSSRSRAGRFFMSSMKESIARPAVNPAISRDLPSRVPCRTSQPIQPPSITVTTAIPPPRGVGTTWLLRSFGTSITARRVSTVISARVPARDATNRTPKKTRAVSSCMGALIAFRRPKGPADCHPAALASSRCSAQRIVTSPVALISSSGSRITNCSQRWN